MTVIKKPLRCLILSFLILGGAALPSVSEAFDDKARIDPFVEPFIQDRLVVGLVIGIVKNGQSQILAYGETVKDSGMLPDENTLYEIGSISKVFTGILLASLVNEGNLRLEDSLEDQLPSAIRVPVFDGNPITLLHLATHTSGLPRMPDNFNPADPLNPYADYSIERMYDFLKEYELKRPPGNYEYSNYGMGLLGHVLALKTVETYEQLLLERICIPLDMKDTRITLNKEQKKRLAPPYDIALKPAKNWDIPTLAGAGAIRSTVNDMIKFIRANIVPNDDMPISRALQMAQRKRHTMEDGLSLGLGWHMARDGITLWHNGGTGGYHSWLAILPSRKMGVVILANTANMRLDQLGEQVTKVAFGLKISPPKPRKTIRIDPARLASYTGYYAMTPDFGLAVTVKEGRLMVQATGQDGFPVFAASENEFFYKVVDAQITFVPDEKGRIHKLILHQNGRHLEAFREK